MEAAKIVVHINADDLAPQPLAKLALRLEVDLKKVERWAREGDVPGAFKMGGRWWYSPLQLFGLSQPPLNLELIDNEKRQEENAEGPGVDRSTQKQIPSTVANRRGRNNRTKSSDVGGSQPGPSEGTAPLDELSRKQRRGTDPSRVVAADELRRIRKRDC